MMAEEPLLIWGGGAIGGTMAASLARAGHPVLLVDIVADHVKACREAGLSISGPIETFRLEIPSLTPDELSAQHPNARFSRIILAVKAQATELALGQLAPFLSPDGFVFSAQNGLNEIAISRRIGVGRTMGCFVNFGADWLGPGEILYGNRGAMVLGELDGKIRERTQAMHRLLSVFEPDAVVTDNIWGYLWGKLAYGAMLFATALTIDSMAENFRDPRREIVFARLGREVMAVALARGVTPIGFPEFDIDAFRPGMQAGRMQAAIAALADYTSKTAKTHTGIYRDLAVRKRKTEVDPQIGIISTLAAEAGIATPAITHLVALIHEIEDGKALMHFETFNRLILTCQTASKAE
ncbi:ApbA Ketopantoate reductase [Rhabdaerophilaceae bacterium]